MKTGATFTETDWSWLEVAKTLQREVVVSDRPTTIRKILNENRLISNIISFTGTNYAALDKELHDWRGTVMDLLRKLSSDMNGNVLIAGLPIPSEPSLSSTVNIHIPSVTPPVFYVMMWSFFGKKVDYLLEKNIEDFEFNVDMKGVSLEESEDHVFDVVSNFLTFRR